MTITFHLKPASNQFNFLCYFTACLIYFCFWSYLIAEICITKLLTLFGSKKNWRLIVHITEVDVIFWYNRWCLVPKSNQFSNHNFSVHFCTDEWWISWTWNIQCVLVTLTCNWSMYILSHKFMCSVVCNQDDKRSFKHILNFKSNIGLDIISYFGEKKTRSHHY